MGQPSDNDPSKEQDEWLLFSIKLVSSEMTAVKTVNVTLYPTPVNTHGFITPAKLSRSALTTEPE